MPLKPPVRIKNKNPQGGNAWMLTFSDLLSLLLTFFVLLFSMNAVQIENWKSVVETMSRQFNPDRIAVVDELVPDNSSDQIDTGTALNLSYLEGLFRGQIQETDLADSVSVIREGDRLRLILAAGDFFNGKSATLSKEGRSMLRAIAGNLANLDNRMFIITHTNQQPVEDSQFVSNWELSMTRGRLVAGVLSSNGYSGPLSIVSYADTRFGELDDTIDLSDRYRLAERVEIVIAYEQYKQGQADVF